MRSVHDLETPAVLVDLDVLERNVAHMAERARAAGVRLRPHAKTHKVVEIARRQIGAGAVGLSVAKTSEAEVFTEAGFDDVFVAYPVVGGGKPERLLVLAKRLRRLAVGVDSVEGASVLASAFRAAGRTLDVMLKIDVGFHRVGVAPENALEVARRLADLPGLRLRGIFTHAGQGYHAETPEAVRDVARHEGRAMVAVAHELRGALALEEVSVGSTPTAREAMTQAGVTECRPGNYVYHDGTQVALGTCAPSDCALTVLATVVSVSGAERAVVDAGSKTLSSDPLRPRAGGYGQIAGRGSRIQRLSEEHGVIVVEHGEPFRVGERLRILPNHACVVSNLHDRVYGVRGEQVETELIVAARGRVE